jgi:hypothetical protein
MVARDSAIRAPFRPAPSRDRVVAIESLEAELKPGVERAEADEIFPCRSPFNRDPDNAGLSARIGARVC